MARRRASMREGPLAELFRATEAAQRQAEQGGQTDAPAQESLPATTPANEPEERTVEHIPSWEEAARAEVPAPPAPPRPDPSPGPPLPDPEPPVPRPDPSPLPEPSPPRVRQAP